MSEKHIRLIFSAVVTLALIAGFVMTAHADAANDDAYAWCKANRLDMNHDDPNFTAPGSSLSCQAIQNLWIEQHHIVPRRIGQPSPQSWLRWLSPVNAAYAAEVPPTANYMDMTTAFTKPDGSAMKDVFDPARDQKNDPNCDRCRDLTLARLVVVVLLASPDVPAPGPGQQRLTPDAEAAWGLQKAARAQWANAIEAKPKEVELTDPQAVMLDKLIAEFGAEAALNGNIIAQAHKMLQPKTPLPEVK